MAKEDVVEESLIARGVRARQIKKYAEEDPYLAILEDLRGEATTHFVPAELQSPTSEVKRQMRTLARKRIENYREMARTMSLAPLPGATEDIIQRMIDDILGLGELENLLSDPHIEDIVINGPQEVMTFRNGRWEKANIHFNSPTEVITLINRAIATSGRQVSRANPVVDARLPDGSRVNIIVEPLAEPSPSVTIRLFPKSVMSLDDLVENGTLTPQAAAFLKMAVEARLNLLVAGGVGAGKTTLANALTNLIPSRERLVIIEDTRELRIRYDEDGHANNVEYLTVHYPSGEGEKGVFQEDLVKNALRMRPDRMILGEVRGAEVLHMIMAANVGHEGMITTVHANSSREAVKRLKQLMQLAELGVELTDKVLSDWIASAFQLGVFIQREWGSEQRQVTEIIEFTGQVEAGSVTTQPLFLTQDGRLERTSFMFHRREKLARAGHSYQTIVAMDSQ